MHDAAEGRVAIFRRQNVSHILISGAGMDDQRQFASLSGLNMNAQGSLLDLGTLGGIVIIQSGFTDGDKL